MYKRIMLGLALVASLSASVKAQSLTTSKPNPTTALQTHSALGEPIFDAAGKWIGLLGQINQDGSVLMWGANGNSARTLPAGALRWTGERLMTSQ